MRLNMLDWQPEDERGSEAEGVSGPPRPWIGVLFECCGVYARIYRAPAERRYEGCCPRCNASVQVDVGPGGTNSRIFRAKP